MNRILLAVFALAIAQDPPMPVEPAKPTEVKPAPQEKKLSEAEAFLKKVEEKATKAKSLRYKAKLTLNEGGKEMGLDGEGSAKEGKFKLDMGGEIEGKPLQVTITCDGKRMRTESVNPGGRAEPQTIDAPKDAADDIRLLLVRVGALVTMVLGDHKRDEAKELKALFDVSGVKFGKEEKIKDRAAKVLEYTLTFNGKGAADNNTAEAKLWVDAETLTPIKREMTTSRGEAFTETFSEWKFDEEIKDDVFALPKEK